MTETFNLPFKRDWKLVRRGEQDSSLCIGIGASAVLGRLLEKSYAGLLTVRLSMARLTLPKALSL